MDGSDEPPDCRSLNKTSTQALPCLEGRDCAHNQTRPIAGGCGSQEFTCDNGRCIPLKKLCDETDQCGDFSDEASCNVNECASGQVCAQVCEDLPIGYRCSCRKGFVPIDGGRVCKDVNECEQQPSPCSQLCRNTYGGFVCSCANGYEPMLNGQDCVAAQGPSPLLLFSNRYAIRETTLGGQAVSTRVSQLSNAVALDFDLSSGCIYWSNITPLGSSIKRQCPLPQSSNPTMNFSSAINGSSTDAGKSAHVPLFSNINTQKQTLHSALLQSPDGLAVDWVAGNLYWCDKGVDTIEVSKLDGRYRRVLIKEGLQEPRAIALHPTSGRMYWTDWGDRPYIGVAGMDGQNSMRLIERKLGWPNALTIDFEAKRLYWADAKEDYIGSSDLEGNRRSVVVSRSNSGYVQHVFALAVFEQRLFWTDWHTRTIAACDKRNCLNSTRLVQLYHRPMDVQVWHPLRQPPFVKNPCDALQCQALCLLRQTNQTESPVDATCACPTDFLLAKDGRTCKANCSRTQFVCKSDLKCIPQYCKWAPFFN